MAFPELHNLEYFLRRNLQLAIIRQWSSKKLTKEALVMATWIIDDQGELDDIGGPATILDRIINILRSILHTSAHAESLISVHLPKMPRDLFPKIHHFSNVSFSKWSLNSEQMTNIQLYILQRVVQELEELKKLVSQLKLAISNSKDEDIVTLL